MHPPDDLRPSAPPSDPRVSAEETVPAGEPAAESPDAPEGLSRSLEAHQPAETAPSAPSTEAAEPGDRSSAVEVAANHGKTPTFLFFGVVAAISLLADVCTKAWAEITMNERGFEPLTVIPGHLNVILAYNRGGAWGLLQNAHEAIRKPFFLGMSIGAVLFIVAIYGRLHPSQKALKWGLPLVLGGALGNLSDRITRSQVIDFIDYQGQWVLAMNTFIRRYVRGWTLTDHWPTFNVADIAICIGVGLMAVDTFTSLRLRRAARRGASGGEGAAPTGAGAA